MPVGSAREGGAYLVGGGDQRKEGMFAKGSVQAQVGGQFLEPGESCPFSLEIYALDYVAYGLHPEGQPVAFLLGTRRPP